MVCMDIVRLLGGGFAVRGYSRERSSEMGGSHLMSLAGLGYVGVFWMECLVGYGVP